MLRSLPILTLPASPSDGNLGSLTPSQVTDRSKHTDNANKENNKPNSVATHTRTIGIIHPPPGIRTIVDKTAQIVVKNGPEFESLIAAKQRGNANFSFLSSSDPYHAYYQHRLVDIRAQAQASAQQSVADEIEVADEREGDEKHVRKVPPEAEKYTVHLPQGFLMEKVDIIKLTAQFVALNGEKFLTELTSKEMNNPEFHFLQPTYSLFAFFGSLVDAYSVVLMPQKGLTDKLRKSIADRTTVLERCLHRLEWERSQEQARRKVEEEVEQERLQMAMIDWHDFVVVETIDFADNEDEELPPPMTREKVMIRSKLSPADETGEKDVVEAENEVAMEMDEEEVHLVEEGMREFESPMRIVKDWKSPEEREHVERDSTKYVKSPITGELIPIKEMSEHMRISLIDPKYKEQRERMYAKIRETTLAQDDEISKNIVGLARLRPDIFGTTEEEVSNAIKAEIEKKIDEQPGGDNIVNYRNGNLLAPVAPPPGVLLVRPVLPPPGVLPCVPPKAVQCLANHGMSPVQMRPPMHIYQGQQPFVPPPPSITVNLPGIHLSAPRPFVVPMPPQHGMHTMPPPPPPVQAPPPLPDEPEPKRQRLDNYVLVPEDQFLAQHPGPVRVSILVPNVDEGNLKGQVIKVTVQSLSETVGSLKEKIAGEVQLPSNKQKLSGKAGFLKDNESLAYYNIAEEEALSLSLRERGGRKRSGFP